MSLLKDLPELVMHNVITAETATRITEYYRTRQENSPNRLYLIFGIMGALLIGVGIMLLIAHQWDNFSRPVKTTIAFLLLLMAQALVAYVLVKKPENRVWCESSGLLLFFAVGATISLVSQIYSINGDMGHFMALWMVLILPVIYLLRASMVSLAYLIGIGIFAVAARVDMPSPAFSLLYWLYLAAVLPFYLNRIRTAPDDAITLLHHWLLPYSLVQVLAIFTQGEFSFSLPAYVSMSTLFLLIGSRRFFTVGSLFRSGYLIIGAAGLIITLLVASFHDTWDPEWEVKTVTGNVFTTTGFYVNCILAILTAWFYLYDRKNREWQDLDFPYLIFAVFAIIYVLSFYTSSAWIFVNILLLIVGVWIIRKGIALNHLVLLNIGMLVITLQAICRTFDDSMDFISKGTLFVLAGICFFLSNWWMVKKVRNHEEKV